MNSSNKSKKVKGIRAWAVVYPGDEIVLYQDYDHEPNNILMRICHTRKLAKQIKVHHSKLIQVEIRPIPKRKRVKR